MKNKSVGFPTKSSPLSKRGKISYLLSDPFLEEEIILGKRKNQVLKFLYKGGNPHSIASDVGIKRPTVIQHLNELQVMGLVKFEEESGKKKYAYPYQISEKGVFLMERCVGFPVDLSHKRRLREGDLETYTNRGHAPIFKIRPDKKFDWVKILNEKNIKWIPKGFAETPRIILNGKKTWLGKKDITIWFPKDESFFNKTPKLSYRDIRKEFYLDMEALMEMLGIEFTYKFSCRRIHNGDVNNEEAKYFIYKGKKIWIKDAGGYWFRIDKSQNKFMEAEIEKDDENFTEATGYKNFMNSKKKNGWITDDLFIEKFNETNERLKKLSEQSLMMSQVMEQQQNNMIKIIKMNFKEK